MEICRCGYRNLPIWDSGDPNRGISRDPVCASATVHTKAVSPTGTPAREFQEKTKETEDDVVEIAFKRENRASGPVCPSFYISSPQLPFFFS